MRLPQVIKLLLHPPSLDVEEGLWELYYLVVSPRKMYRSLYYRQQTKNQWSRDDPSFVILMCILLALSALAWGLAFSSSILGMLRLVVYMVAVDFLVTGVIISTVFYFVANKLSAHNRIEWAYCFDVHCNSFFVVFLWLYILQFTTLPLLTQPYFISTLVGNLLYFTALTHYFVITFLGYAVFPFMKRAQLFLLPVLVVGAVCLFMSVFNVSIVHIMLEQYFDI